MTDKKSKVKVLMLGPSLQVVGGISTHLKQLFNSRLANEFQLEHFCTGSEAQNESFASKLMRFICSPVQLASKIVATRPDIVHLNTTMDSKAYWRDSVYMLVIQALGRKIIYQLHGGEVAAEFFQHNALIALAKKWLLSIPDAVVLLSTTEQRAAKGFCHFRRLEVIPNAIDMEQYATIGPKSFAKEKLKLGYIGRLVDTKGIIEGITAMDILRRKGVNNLTFLIAGAGPYETSLRDKVRELRLEDRVSFLGTVYGTQKLAFWREVDISIFPTYFKEGLPYTVLESLAAGTPLVTTQNAGITDAVLDGVHGVFVREKDAAAIANAVQELNSDRPRLEEMSKACTQRAQEYYDIQRLAEQFGDLYRDILEHQGDFDAPRI